MIKVYCNGTHIQCLRRGELNVGMAGAPVEFDFSSEWDGLAKTAVFRCGGERDMIIGADGKTTVPHEILTTPGMDVEVGVYAVKEDGTTWPAPTTYCKIGRVGEGADPSGDESYPPTPDVGEQAVAAASKALEAAAEAQAVAADIQRRADSGEFDGAPGYTPVKGEDYFDGNDYVLTEADKVEIAEIAADLVDVPESGGSADLTGYATEEWVEKGYQPKGDYATKDEIPPVPTKLSAFTNDAGFVTEDALENVGGKAYVQDTEPDSMEVGEFWYNPDEETEGIPTTLPNPHKLTFSGAVSAEYDGSEAVEVVIPQGGGGGGGEKQIVSFTVAEDVTQIDIPFTNEIAETLNTAREIIFDLCFTLPAEDNATAQGKLNFGIGASWGMQTFFIQNLACLPTNAQGSWRNLLNVVGKVLLGRLNDKNWGCCRTDVADKAANEAARYNTFPGTLEIVSVRNTFRLTGEIPIGAGSTIAVYVRG